MKFFLRRYSALVIAQTACLALGLWLEHRFAVSSANSSTQSDVIARSSAHTPEATAVGKGPTATSKPPSAAIEEIPALAIKATALLWIAAIQAVVAYLILTRGQEETARKHRQVENVSLQQYNELLRTRDAIIFGLAKLAESRDPGTGNHLERIAIYSTRLASAARFEPGYRDQITSSFIKLIGISSALHDIGKVGVRDSILLKPGRLEQQERLLIQLHAAIGGKCIHDIEARLGRSNFLKMAREIAYNHHEHWDGTGYPKGLAGEDIPLAARIVAIADVYDALGSKRIYKKAYSHKKCVQMIREGAGKHFDPLLIKIFLKLEAEFHDIARSCRETTEEGIPDLVSTEGAKDLAPEAEFSLSGKLSEIEAMLKGYTEDLSACEESCAKHSVSTSSEYESLQPPASINQENDLSKIEQELKNVP